jgi:hypothetical protein
METVEGRLTVYFEAPFWVGVLERITDGTLQVCKITFGAEPKDGELYEFLLRNWNSLQFSPPTKNDAASAVSIRPKRMQREIAKQLRQQGIGTKSQQALKLQHEQNKTLHKKETRRQKEAEKQRQFELRQEKKKQKAKGH